MGNLPTLLIAEEKILDQIFYYDTVENFHKIQRSQQFLILMLWSNGASIPKENHFKTHSENNWRKKKGKESCTTKNTRTYNFKIHSTILATF